MLESAVCELTPFSIEAEADASVRSPVVIRLVATGLATCLVAAGLAPRLGAGLASKGLPAVVGGPGALCLGVS